MVKFSIHDGLRMGMMCMWRCGEGELLFACWGHLGFCVRVSIGCWQVHRERGGNGEWKPSHTMVTQDDIIT